MEWWQGSQHQATITTRVWMENRKWLMHGKWKMIFSEGSGGRQKPIGNPFGIPYQLYDLDKDPSETLNLIDETEDMSIIFEERHKYKKSLSLSFTIFQLTIIFVCCISLKVWK